MSSKLVNIQIFEVSCSHCHKVREVRAKEGTVGSKDIEFVECVCGNLIPIVLLKYLFRSKDYMEDTLKFIVF